MADFVSTDNDGASGDALPSALAPGLTPDLSTDASATSLPTTDAPETTEPVSLSTDLPTEDLHNVQIIKTGTWVSMAGDKVTFTQADLAELVSNYQALKGVIKPYLKLGHIFDGDHSKLTGAPALGWMDNVRLSSDGNTVLADFKKVPAKVHALIKAGSYRRISAEILRNFSDSAGKTWRLAFKAASILGATLPAVNTLDDIMNLFGEGDRATALDFNNAEMVALSEPTEDSVMNDTQLAALRLSLGLAPDADASAVLAAAASLQKANTDATVKLSEIEEQNFSAGVDLAIKKARETGRLLPATNPASQAQENGMRTMVDGWKATAKDGVMQFADGKGKGSVLEAFSNFIEQLPQVFPVGKESGSGKVSKTNSVPAKELPEDLARFCDAEGIAIDAESLEMDRAITGYAKENKTDYFTAYAGVNGLDLNAPIAN